MSAFFRVGSETNLRSVNKMSNVFGTFVNILCEVVFERSLNSFSREKSDESVKNKKIKHDFEEMLMDQGQIPKVKEQSGIFNRLKNTLINTHSRYPNKKQIFRVLEHVKNHGIKYDNLSEEDGSMLDKILCDFLKNKIDEI